MADPKEKETESLGRRPRAEEIFQAMAASAVDEGSIAIRLLHELFTAE